MSFLHVKLSQFRRWGMGKRKARISWLDLASAAVIGLGLVPIVCAAPGQIRWQYRPSGDAINSSPAIGNDGTIYVNSDDGHLYALVGETGVVKWKVAPPGGYMRNPSSAAVGPEGTVYVGCGDGTIRAYHGATGTNQWVFATQNSIYSSPAINDLGIVYVGSLNKKLYALDGATGEKLWEFKTGWEIWSSPSVGAGGTVYAGSADGKVYALDGRTGLECWEFETDGAVIASPAITLDGCVVVGSEDQKVYALDGFTGAKCWEFETGGPIWCSAAIGPEGTVYVGSDDGVLYALDVHTGQQRWAHTLGDVIWSSPAVAADGTVYVGCDNGWLYAVSGATGEELWKFKTGGRVWSSPGIGPDGTVYVGTTEGKIFALEGSAPLASSGWPKFRAAACSAGVMTQPPPTTPPVILWQPEVAPLKPGTNGFLAVRVAGLPAACAWYRNGTAISGATNALLWFAPVKQADEGLYTVVLSNRLGQTTSQPIAAIVSNVDAQRVVELEWEADAPSLFKVESSKVLGPAAKWDGSVYAVTGSGPITVSGRYQTQPSCFFRLVGWADSRINRLGLRYGFKLSGSTGSHYTVEYVTRGTGWTNWQVLTNLTLSTSPQLFADHESSWAIPRFYRLRP